MTLYSKLKKVNDHPTDESRIAELRNIKSRHILEILACAYNENIVWLLPEGEPPYTPSKDMMMILENRLAQEMKSLLIFVNVGPYPHMKESKRQSIFIDILESIAPEDAILLLALKEKRLPFEHLSRELVFKAFPELIVPWTKMT